MHGFLREHVPTPLCCDPVRRHVDDRLELHLIEQPPVLRKLRTLRAKVGQHTFLADVDAAAADLDRAVTGEQIRRLAPELFISIKAVDPLQVLDRVLVLEARNVMS